ncbi:MAG: hypothetical protein ACKOF7_06515 [Phycisphaerales bacterium]
MRIRTPLTVLAATVTLGALMGTGPVPTHSTRAILEAMLAQSADPNQLEEQRASYQVFVDTAVVYVNSFDTMMLEADDAVRTLERAPADGAAPPKNGEPRFLDSKRAREDYQKELKEYAKSVKMVEAGAKAKMPADRADAVRAMVRAAKSDERALVEVGKYIATRGDDKHEEFAKARAKLNSVRTGPLSLLRVQALNQLGIATQVIPFR